MAGRSDQLYHQDGYDADGNSSDLFNKNWPADLHLIGKDIIRFHTIYWPIFLMALDLPLPKQVFGHPWLLQGGEKMSKSKGNVIYADDMADLFGVDATRYFVLHEMPFENDGIITWDLVIERYNSDLANILGNLVNRTISMSNKYFDGVVKSTGVTEEVDADLKAVVTSARDKVAEKMKICVLQMQSQRYLTYSAAATNTLMRLHRGYLQRTRQQKTGWQKYFIIW